MDRGHFGHGGVILDSWILSPDNRFIDWGQFGMFLCIHLPTNQFLN